jgi:hypothetical protein
MLFAGCDRLMGVVNAHQCSNCDLHLAGDNLTKIVASFFRAFLVMKDNVEQMCQLLAAEHRLKGDRDAYEEI